MKFFIYCDFATLKCSRKEFAEKLSTICSSVININNFLWEIEYDEFSVIPYSDNQCETIFMYYRNLFLLPASLRFSKYPNLLEPTKHKAWLFVLQM